MQINGGRMLERLVLLSHNIDNSRVTMSHADGDDSAKRVEISAAVLVPEILHFPFHQHDRLFVVEKNSWIQELFAQMQDFISRRAAVFLRFVIEWRKLGTFHVDIAADGKRSIYWRLLACKTSVSHSLRLVRVSACAQRMILFCRSSTAICGRCVFASSAVKRAKLIIVTRSPILPKWAVAPFNSIKPFPGAPYMT